MKKCIKCGEKNPSWISNAGLCSDCNDKEVMKEFDKI